MKIVLIWLGLFLLAAAYVVAQQTNRAPKPAGNIQMPIIMTNKITKSDEEWKKELSPEQYHVLREKGTERAFTGKLTDNHMAGQYKCAGCGLVLFASEAKFDSGCGWPSFDKPVGSNAVVEHADNSFGMHRIEVLCPRCGGHLGHVFDDGPTKTGMRYCINSVSLKFEPATNQLPMQKK